MTWRHGTTTGYSRHRCRCEACMTAWRDYQRRYMRERYHGLSRTGDATEARQWLATLVQNGWTLHAVAKAAGMDHQLVRKIATGEHKRARTETLSKILGVAIGDRPAGTNTPAAEAVELMDAMLAAGLLSKDIAEKIKVTAPARLRRQRVVEPLTRARLVTAYRLLTRAGLVPPRLDLEEAS